MTERTFHTFRLPSLDALVYSAAGLIILLIGSWVPDERISVSGVPIDVVLLIAAVLLATTARVDQQVWRAFLMLQIPLVLLAIPLVWSPDPYVGLDKLTALIISTAVAFVCFTTVIEKHGEQELINILLFYFAGLLLLAFLYKLVFGLFNRQVPFFINGPIVFARYMGVATILAFFSLQGRARWITMTVFCVAVLWSESKGPIVALAITLLALVYWRVDRRLRLAIITFIVLVLVGLAFAASNYGIEARDLGRLGLLFALLTGDTAVLNTNLATGSVQTRFEMWVVTGPIIMENPFGVGLGGWPDYANSQLILPAPYPHNLFLELWSEAGILLGTLTALPFMVFLLARTKGAIWYSALVLFLAQQVSGDIGDARFLLTLSLLAALMDGGKAAVVSSVPSVPESRPAVAG